ncbi:hypothetical protein EDC94DRAFT_660200 [Helicostylum pulchrum]|uniref:Fe2OG dioxygenase domain-containing protein n=1 Tax=Helicostylum pulchrum TaxID=562976 RepID=A0ABP9YAB3_9FUNG|nr:hypothetical protein EDC94DRAFT_660200 [Helicostylum pulchrum]
MDWKELFGSDSEDEEETEIPGLTLVRQALDHAQQMAMTNAIIEQKYFFDNVNQAMCFGELPSYLSWLSQWVLDECPHMFNTDILNREPLFDQAILNLYKKGEGICSHVDLLRFEDGILIVSLLSSCVMTLKEIATDTTIDLLLNPGDILSLSGESRYQWEHGIKEQLFDTIDDQVIERGTRISVTLRKLKRGATETTATTSTYSTRY